MARKNLLSALTDEELPAGNSTVETSLPAAQRPFGGMSSHGALGAVSRSIEQLKAHSIVELATDLIDDSSISDRLETSHESHAGLVALIRDHGQQVPILVRPHPHLEGRYQIVYGRRRLRAARELGRAVRSIIKQLTDTELVVAQGQENSAREDLTFIERAVFSARLASAGHSRETIMAALAIDKSGLSRLITCATKIPLDLIEAIGPAPKAGRDRWVQLADRLEDAGALAIALHVRVGETFRAKSSDERFHLVFNAVAPKRPKGSRPTIWKADDGARVARIFEDQRNVTLAINKRAAGEFGAYLIEQLPEIYAAYQRRKDA